MQVVEAIAAAGEVAMAKEYAEGFFGVSELSGIDLSDEALQAAAARFVSYMLCATPSLVGVGTDSAG